MKTLGAAVALLSVYGCATDSQPSGSTGEGTGSQAEALGDNVASCTGGTGWTSASGALVVDCSTALKCPSHTVILAPGNAVVRVNGRVCADSNGNPISLTSVKTISVLGTAAASDTFIADFTAGLPTGSLLSANGVTFNGNEAAGTTTPDVFVMKGSTGNDNVTVGQVAATSQFDISLTQSANVANIVVKNVGNTDGAHDHDPTMAFVLAAGNDVFSGMGYTNGGVTVPAVNSQAALTIYGGDGNDTITGGGYNDTIVAGTGNDTIKSPTKDGADAINCGGDSGDVMDYSGRLATHPVQVDLDSAKPSLFGSSLLAVTPVAADSFTIQTDSAGSAGTVTFVGGDTPASIVALINAAVGSPVASLVGPYLRIVSQADEVVITGAQASEAGLVPGTYPSGVTVPANGNDGEVGEFDDVQSCASINGGADNDVLVGNTITNTLTGNAGDDVLNGGPVNATCASDKDVLNGNAGNDWFDMGAAFDCNATLAGGAGTDVVDYSQRTGANCGITIKGDGTASSGLQSVGGVCAHIETDSVGSDVEVQFGSSTLPNVMSGTASADWLFGGGGNDVIKGGAGDDTLYGGAGNDELDGETGNDTFYETAGYPATAGMNGNGLADTLPGWLQYVGFKMWNSATSGPGWGNDIVNGGNAAAEVNHAYFGTDAANPVLVSLCTDTNNDGDNVCKLDATYGPHDDDGIAAGNADNTNDVVNIQWLSGSNGVAYALGGGAATANVIIGTPADETLEGGGALDVILGQGGNDTIFGFADGSTDAASVDVLCGGDGTDSIFGGGAAFVEGEGQFQTTGASKVLATSNTGNCGGGAGASTLPDPSCCYAPSYSGTAPAPLTITGDTYSVDLGGFDICKGYASTNYDMCEVH